jgi:flagellar hook-length control protein FliK
MQQGDGVSVKTPGAEGRLAEDALARELRGNLGQDIVKQANIIVKNANEGTIRLALNPASLGQVKVHLEMTENKIIGHIVVESSEALRAFSRELPVLEKAFKDSGFEFAQLEMMLAEDFSANDGGRHNERDTAEAGIDLALAASRYDMGADFEGEAVSDTGIFGAGFNGAVNLYV